VTPPALFPAPVAGSSGVGLVERDATTSAGAVGVVDAREAAGCLPERTAVAIAALFEIGCDER
jgi:hypothetical protein